MTHEEHMMWRTQMVCSIMENIHELAKKAGDSGSVTEPGPDLEPNEGASGSGKGAQDQAQSQGHSMGSEPSRTREPRPYHVVAQPPTSSNPASARPSPPTPAPPTPHGIAQDEVETVNQALAEHLERKGLRRETMTTAEWKDFFKEVLLTRASGRQTTDIIPEKPKGHGRAVEDVGMSNRLNAGLGSRKSDDGRRRAAAPEPSMDSTAVPAPSSPNVDIRDDVQNPTHEQDDPAKARRQEAYNALLELWTTLPPYTRTAIKSILASAIKSILASSIIGALSWKFFHSRLAGELFTEAIAGIKALKLVGRGLMGLSTAMARGVWAVMKHLGRHPKGYGCIGAVYGLWKKGKLHVLGQVVFVGMFLWGCWQVSERSSWPYGMLPAQ